MNSQQEAYEVWRSAIADELEREDARMSNADKWIHEIGFWVGLIGFLGVLWLLVGSYLFWG